MKKLLLVPFLALGLVVGGLSMKSAPTAVHAEEIVEVEVAEETFTCEEDGNKATLVLKSDYTFSMTLEAADGLSNTVSGSYTRNENIVTLVFGGSTIDLSLDVINHTFGDVEELTPSENSEESVSDKISNFKDTYLVPLLSGVSIASLVSIFLSILGFVLNRKFKHERKESEDVVLGSVLNLISKFTELLTEISTTNALSKDTAKAFTTECDNLLKQFEFTKDIPTTMAKVAKCEVAIANIVSKIAAHSKDLVSCGIAEDCQAVVNELKGIVK